MLLFFFSFFLSIYTFCRVLIDLGGRGLVSRSRRLTPKVKMPRILRDYKDFIQFLSYSASVN